MQMKYTQITFILKAPTNIVCILELEDLDTKTV